ncbi:hypothetical protein A1O3_06577 [Capronia epimyces CBS 606.96]|uniref:3-oxoacyl-[acyl-carrier protein] reductase n=1 Tax=Capronia epimyces CBS 606.96 TaxID=1182542 RepID=W9XQD4_9EURO|nr:uncharacterized protein A1O3_06577 [Capronia epimyces CBS 606.96]EXJ82762.1 hypothetical protein A1O3_06577 [Capronia epimyces CBS 606.96]
MKDTLRKKPKASSSGDDLDTAAQSSESVSPNPWVNEAFPAADGELLSPQASKASKSSDTTSPDQSVSVIPPTTDTEERSQSRPPATQHLNVPDVSNGTEEPVKPTRRRKTITKTPHTFELEVDLNPTKQTEQPPLSTMEPPKQEMPGPKKKKRVSQPPLPNGNSTGAVTISAVASTQPSTRSNSPGPAPTISAVASPSTPVQSPPPPSTTVPSPLSPKTATSAGTPVNPFTTHRPKKSISSSTAQAAASNPCRFTPPPLPKEAFHGKVVVLTNGASQTGKSLVRQFHSAGCRVIFGDTNSDQARKLICSLGPPHIVHFNKCDMTKYSDILELFKLAITMYGRVDHAIFGVGDDGGQTCTVGEGEKGWFEDRKGFNKTARMAYSEVETEPTGLGDVMTASIRFARIALAYLKYSPRTKAKKSIVNPYSTPQPDSTASEPGKDDRSLTFITSIAAFKDTPLLPIYQATQHSILGLVRSLRTTIDPDPQRDGVRINAVATNIMVPCAIAQSGGRMSVQLPPDRPEDIAQVVAGVVATNSSTAASTEAGGDTGITNGGGIWYEKGFERGVRERYLHGRVIYSVGVLCWDVQEGLDRSEPVWIGARPSEALAKGMGGLNLTAGGTGASAGAGAGGSWILDLS